MFQSPVQDVFTNMQQKPDLITLMQYLGGKRCKKERESKLSHYIQIEFFLFYLIFEACIVHCAIY